MFPESDMNGNAPDYEPEEDELDNQVLLERIRDLERRFENHMDQFHTEE